MRQLRRMPNVMVVPLTYVWIYFTFNVIKWTRYTSGVISDLARVLQRKLWTIYARCGPYFSGDFGPYSHLSWILRTTLWFLDLFLPHSALNSKKSLRLGGLFFACGFGPFWKRGPYSSANCGPYSPIFCILGTLSWFLGPFLSTSCTEKQKKSLPDGPFSACKGGPFRLGRPLDLYCV